MTRRAPTMPPGKPGRPEIEALSELTWARVEKRLWAELDRAPGSAETVVAEPPRAAVAPGRRRWWLAAGALAAAAVIAVVAWPSATSSPSTHALPSRVATASDATEVSFGDATIVVAPTSAVLLNGQADRRVAIVLERGSADFAVAPRVGRPPFVVHAGAVQVRVVGTRFRVSRSGDAVRVVVTHGEVEVVAWGRREVILAGASWSSDGVREAAVGRSAPVTNPDGVAAAHLSPSVERERGPGRASPRPSPTPAGSAAAPEEPVVGDDPRKAAFDRAAALEASDPATAIRLYRQIASGDDRWAATALFSAARLSDVLGDRDSARKFASAYLERFDRGDNARDAKRLLERLTGGSP